MDLSKNIKGTYGTMYYVTDMKKTVQYYKEVFNLTPEYESAGWTEFKMGDHRLCLHSAGENHTPTGKGILITEVTGLDTMVAELKKRGVEFVSDVQSVCDGGYAADYRDPSGNTLSLFEYRG